MCSPSLNSPRRASFPTSGPNGRTTATVQAAIRRHRGGVAALFRQRGAATHHHHPEYVPCQALTAILNRVGASVPPEDLSAWLHPVGRTKHGFGYAQLLGLLGATAARPRAPRMQDTAGAETMIARFRRAVLKLLADNRLTASQLFNQLAVNSDGLVTRLALAKGMRSHGHRLNEEQTELLFGLAGVPGAASMDVHRFGLLCHGDAGTVHSEGGEGADRSDGLARAGQVPADSGSGAVGGGGGNRPAENRAAFFLRRIRALVQAEITGKRLDLAAVFNAFDDDKDGKITSGQFRMILRRMSFSIVESQIEDILRSAMVIRGGLIDYKEFTHKVAAIPPHDTLRMQVKMIFNTRQIDIRQFFKVLDRDGDGALSRREFGEGLKALNIGISERQIEDMMDLIDKDGDVGSNLTFFPSAACVHATLGCECIAGVNIHSG